ncbi:MAG: acetamidase/formamidase family protein [Acidobacteriaceae bacterium]|nr:acetamidase/formamidase family protein [Acidobacteriaceae bacterium]
MRLWTLLFAMPLAAATHTIVAESYFHSFSAAHPVLLRVRPGDTIVTKTVDSAGFDFANIRRTKTHGNPLTGPFYIEGAEPGDAIAVRIVSLQTNRRHGYTGRAVGVRELPAALEAPMPDPDAVVKGYSYLVPWVIDPATRTAYPKNSPAGLRFPLRPMLGCIGVAPKGDYSPRSGPAGYWGGNLDYNRVRPGATVLLPVHHAGGLLFFGDGHALQGDGEAIGSGVETSLDVTVTVGLVKQAGLTAPRMETAGEIIAIGAKPDGNLNETLSLALTDMLSWLTAGYGLAPGDAHLLIGAAAQLDILTLGGSTAVRIPRATLPKKQNAKLPD